MTELTPNICPHLGLASDRTLTRTAPDDWHRCYAQTPPVAPHVDHQRALCLSTTHSGCPSYVAPPAADALHAAVPKPVPRWLRVLPWAALAVMLLVVTVVYARVILGPPANASPPPTSAALVAAPGATAPSAETDSTSDPAPATPAVASPARSARYATPTPEPGGRVLTLSPRAGEAGWWSNADARGNHLGDSFLHAGYFNGQTYISAIAFDLRNVPRGAPIRDVTLSLTGLKADRFTPGAGGTWSLQLLPAGALPDLARSDFQKLLSAPISATLLPALVPANLAEGQANRWRLDASARAWLGQQVLEGAPSIIARITGPAGGRDTLFAWDSGAGAETAGNAPELVLSLGPAPSTPPPLPTGAVIVATSTPTPANVLTVAAHALTATYVATTVGTYTPAPYMIVTPTPLPANLATAQAQGFGDGRLPIVVYTPTPANAATAAADSAYATAVAVTTGTFTPVPANAVTPVVVLPTPMPKNVATAAAQLLAATAQAEQTGTATSLPFGAVIATTTPEPPILVDPPTPANYATVAARIEYATAVAVTTGTFTPIPPDALYATPEPEATPLPLLIEVTPALPPSPTSTPPGAMPAELSGKVLFYSDRAGSPRLYALDPTSGGLTWVTQEWPFDLAWASVGKSPDGNYAAQVQMVSEEYVANKVTGAKDTRSVARIFVHDNQYNTSRQLTSGNGWSYDPAWSPKGDRIAFVSQEPGNDEIYTMNPDGSDQLQLTSNTWEWDKHPSWSPDGSQIVFWSNRDAGHRQLWVMDADGNNQRLLLSSSFNDWDPIWVR